MGPRGSPVHSPRLSGLSLYSQNWPVHRRHISEYLSVPSTVRTGISGRYLCHTQSISGF